MAKIEKMGHLLGKNLNFKKMKRKGSHTVFDPMPISEGVSKNSGNLPDPGKILRLGFTRNIALMNAS